MVMEDSALLQSKFRGSLLGTLLGDCCGAPFEDEILESGDKLTLHNYFDKLEGPFFTAPVKLYTDDTAMTKVIAKHFIENRDIDSKKLAEEFMREYFKEPRRGYGSGVANLFEKFRKTKLADPLGLAREQFGGNGSYGNGSAMRIAPVGLFCHNKTESELIDLAKKSSEVTHAHKLGINGGILQALALWSCLKIQPKDFEKTAFINHLCTKFETIETDEEGLGLDTEKPFYNQLQAVKRMITLDNVTEEEILNTLGHGVQALYSVPTAIFCFIRAQQEMEEVKTDNPFRRTLEYAISLGGDTDTIAAMAGSLAGALHGDTIISDKLIKHCEAHKEIVELAQQLYGASL